MKLRPVEVPEKGLRVNIRLDADARPRLQEALAAMPGSVSAEILVKARLSSLELRGTLTGQLEIPCPRCAEALPLAVDEVLEITVSPARLLDEGMDEQRLSSADLDVSFYEGDTVDLAELVEDEILLLSAEACVPEDAQGRCLHCGKFSEAPAEQTLEDGAENPFTALGALLDPQKR